MKATWVQSAETLEVATEIITNTLCQWERKGMRIDSSPYTICYNPLTRGYEIWYCE